jgi:acetoin utilization deacetylase AcuC-like enzyme
MTPRWINRLLRRWFQRDLTVWYDPAYRLPLSGLEGHVGMEPRRADFVAWYLVDNHILPSMAIRTPTPISYGDLGRVHDTSWLESLATPAALARVFACAPEEIQVDPLMLSIRLACGGTLAAAEWAIAEKKAALNLLGGFHHASRASGGGYCAVNDMAVALATLRANGFSGHASFLDLDAHPPDGTADCVKGDGKVWIGSLSGCDWGKLEAVDETVLPKGTGDVEYLEALDGLLERMPETELVFVIAGGDVLAGDRLGSLGLSLAGIRERDLRLATRLRGIPSVWLPGGGYHQHAWRVLAGTALALSLHTGRAISTTYDPLARRFAAIAEGLAPGELRHDDDGESGDILAALGLGSAKKARALGYYTAEGIEYALDRYGLLYQIRRLGYTDLQVQVDTTGTGDRMQLFGKAHHKRHLLIENVVERRNVGGHDVLYIHWLTLRHPLAQFTEKRPQLPGQEVPGLGMAREMSELELRIAIRLGFSGIAFRPSWYHMAYAARARFYFVDPQRQARFLAMVRDLGKRSLLDVTLACAHGRVRMNGEPYTWEADEMVYLLDEPLPENPAVQAEAEKVRFTMAEEEKLV